MTINKLVNQIVLINLNRLTKMSQSYLLVRHKIKDYQSWKNVFDSFIDIRRKGGEKSFQIFCPETEPNNLYLLFVWDTLDNAKKFVQSTELKDTMMKAGVIEAPEILFLEEMASGIIIKFPEMKH